MVLPLFRASVYIFSSSSNQLYRSALHRDMRNELTDPCTANLRQHQITKGPVLKSWHRRDSPPNIITAPTAKLTSRLESRKTVSLFASSHLPILIILQSCLAASQGKAKSAARTYKIFEKSILLYLLTLRTRSHRVCGFGNALLSFSARGNGHVTTERDVCEGQLCRTGAGRLLVIFLVS